MIHAAGAPPSATNAGVAHHVPADLPPLSNRHDMSDPTAPPSEHELIAAMASAFDHGGWDAGTELPSHMSRCFGCGPDNPHGIGIRVVVSDEPDAVHCDHVFDHRHQGAPGVSHGGAVAAAVDDLFGFVLVRVLTPAVTRDLALRYRLPVRLNVPTRLQARLVERVGRELHMEATVSQDDVVVATATAVFIEVDLDHLSAPAARFGLT
jgi:acyl-coenzyme A thioesterase PaaI-like protein